METERKAQVTQSDFNPEQPEVPIPRFIILESGEEVPLSKLSPILIQMVISSMVNLKSVKTFKNWNHPDRNIKYVSTLLKTKKFHNICIKAYPIERLNSPLVHSGDLSLCTIEDISGVKKKTKEKVIDIERITIKKKKKSNN